MTEFDDIPPALRRDLKAAAPRLEVPRAVDDAIRASARRQFSHRPRTRWLPWALTGSAIAASIAVAAVMYTALYTGSGVPVADDVNRDGKVDIIDALALAQKLDAGQTVRAPWDRTRLLTRGDVDRIARRIVMLAPPTHADGGPRGAMVATICELGPLPEDRP